jgi:outer membrane immunogenic protein
MRVFSAAARRSAVRAGGLLVASCCVALAASPAAAQSTDETPFGGFRLEVITGWDNAGVNYDDTFEDGRNSQDGIMYGVGAGYDFQFGSAILGVEAELSDSTAGKTDSLAGSFQSPVVNPLISRNIAATVHTDAGGDFYIGVRAGYQVSPNMMIYAKGGYTHATIDIDGSGTLDGVPFTFDDGLGLDGMRLGVGGELTFSKHWYAKLEYRYSNYNNGDLDINGVDVDLDAAFGRMDVDRHQVVLGAGLRF